MYIKLSVGYGLSADSDLKVSQGDDTRLTIRDVEWEDNSLSGPSARYTDVRFGYFFLRKPWLGVAVDFLHFKIFAEVEDELRISGVSEGVEIPPGTVAPMSTYVQRYIVGNGVNFLPVSLLFRHRARQSERYPHGRIQPYAGLGVGPTLLYTQSTVHGKQRGGPYEFGNAGFVLVAGTQFHVSRRWDLFFEYKRTYSKLNGSIKGGSSETELNSNHFTAGGGFHF